MYDYGYSPDGLLTGVLMGGALYIFFVLAIAFLSYYIFYRIIKAAVRNGVVEAMEKTGNSGTFVKGYPPPQDYGAPPAPHYTGR